MLFRLAIQSLLSRRMTAALTVFAIALSVALFLGVEKVRTGAKTSFTDTISDTDLIMGARSGSVTLLLYSVFRIGNASNNISWATYEKIAARDEIAWIVPLSLGDSHRGFRVLGTNQAYFDRYKYRRGHDLSFRSGGPFLNLFDAVVGSAVAETLDYDIGDPIIVSHGIASFSDHEDRPFKVVGVLEKTGTPADRTVYVSLEAIEAIHIDWQDGSQAAGQSLSAAVVKNLPLQPKAITAAMIGVKSKMRIFGLQRYINEFPDEPLMAVLPGVALQELWGIVGVAEAALIVVSAMVVVTALLGMAAMIFSSLNERRREMAILRSIGASPRTIIGLLVTEATAMTALGVGLGVGVLYTCLVIAQPLVDARFGLYLPISGISLHEAALLVGIVVAGGLVSLAPSARAYQLSLADGMTVKI